MERCCSMYTDVLSLGNDGNSQGNITSRRHFGVGEHEPQRGASNEGHYATNGLGADLS